MKWLKYIGIFLCVLLIIGTLPSVFSISKGLVTGPVDDPIYFVGKLAAYLGVIGVLAFISVKLFRSAKR